MCTDQAVQWIRRSLDESCFNGKYY